MRMFYSTYIYLETARARSSASTMGLWLISMFCWLLCLVSFQGHSTRFDFRICSHWLVDWKRTTFTFCAETLERKYAFSSSEDGREEEEENILIWTFLTFKKSLTCKKIFSCKTRSKSWRMRYFDKCLLSTDFDRISSFNWLLMTSYWPSTDFYWLSTDFYWPSTDFLLRSTNFLRTSTNFPLTSTDFLLTSTDFLLTFYELLLTFYGLLLTFYRLLLTFYVLLLTFYWLRYFRG